MISAKRARRQPAGRFPLLCLSGLFFLGPALTVSARAVQARQGSAGRPVHYEGTINRSFALPGSPRVMLTATNLHVVSGTGTQAASRGSHFVAFSLRVQNGSSVPIARAGRLMEGLRPAEGDPAGRGGAGSQPSALDRLAAPGGSTPEEETLVIAPGQEHTFTLSGGVSDRARRLVFRGTFVTDPNGPNQRPRSYVIDLGEAPAYTAAADTVVPRGEAGLLNGIRVKVLRASVIRIPANGSGSSGDMARILAQAANNGNGSAAARQNAVTVGVDVEIGNPLTTSFYVQPLTLVTLENAAGTRTYPRVLTIGSPDALEATDLAPRKQITGVVYFSVPRAELTGLRARFNPEVGHGTVVVPLGAVTP